MAVVSSESISGGVCLAIGCGVLTWFKIEGAYGEREYLPCSSLVVFWVSSDLELTAVIKQKMQMCQQLHDTSSSLLLTLPSMPSTVQMVSSEKASFCANFCA